MAHKIDTTLTGAAGEHLVLSRLLQRGIIASQAPEGLRTFDILVSFFTEQTSVLLQVKSRQFGSDGGWHMSEKHEKIRDSNLYYCFVNFEPAHPSVYVVPSKVVADAIKADYRVWLDTPGSKGKPHKPNKLRRLKPNMSVMPIGWMDEYLENWESLRYQQFS